MLISILDKLSQTMTRVNKNPLKVFQSLNFITFILYSIQISIRKNFLLKIMKKILGDILYLRGKKYCLFMALFSISIWL